MQNLLRVSKNNAFIEYNTKILLCSNGYIELKKYNRTLERKKDGYEEQENQQENQQKFKCTRAKKNTSGIISKSNLSKTRNNLIALACENEDVFTSFITLTLSNNENCEKRTEIDINNIGQANRLFNIWVTQIRRKYPNFVYICVPEYQKRGAVHYHLLSNLRCGVEIPAREPIQTYNTQKKRYYNLEYYDIPFWNYGYSTAFDIKKTDDNFNLALYITKYLYKDIDNRLFGRQKVLRSKDLRKPKEVFCNSPTYEQAINYIKEKGYSINQYEFQPTEEYQIPFTKSSTKISQYDYNTLCDYITRATK